MTQKGLAPILIVLILAALIGGYLVYQKQIKPVNTRCTKEAQICPDGSSVGRVGPKCEFTPCPSLKDASPVPTGAGETANWKTYTSSFLHFSVSYPSANLTPNFFDISSDYSGNDYKARGFENAGELAVGSLETKDNTMVSTKGYTGINFTIYYFANKDLNSLKNMFPGDQKFYQTHFYLTDINGQQVGVLDETKDAQGLPPGFSKFYYFKIGNDLLRIDTQIWTQSSQEDQTQVFALLDQIVKTFKFTQ